MKVQSWKAHVAWLLSSIQGRKKQLKTAPMGWLDVDSAAGPEEPFQTGMPEAHDHLTTTIGRLNQQRLTDSTFGQTVTHNVAGVNCTP